MHGILEIIESNACLATDAELSLLLFDSLVAGNSQTWFPAG